MKEQDKDICIKAVEKNGDALRYVDAIFFKDQLEHNTCDKIVLTKD